MGSITKESLEQLRQKVDLVDLLSNYVELHRSGAYHKACCPFHNEKTPSFVVQAGSSFYHCFGCQAHGDAIAFLMEHQRLSFTEAVEFLAQRYQIILEYDHQASQNQNKKKFLEALAFTNHFFHQTLLESKEGEEALQYLKTRAIDLPFIKKFELGLAPADGKKLAQKLKEQNYSQSELQEIGLLNQYGSAFFFDRITFPIRNAQGMIIGFSARLFKESTKGGKYINSKESFLFKKSNVLFGLNYSRMRLAKGKKALIVEGQIDALRLIDHGLNATVAPLGTALTESHVDKLVQLGVEQAYLAFDSDEAGLNAALKSGHLLQRKRITTYIVPLPKKADPDSYLRERGAKAFAGLLNKKIDYLSFMLRIFSTVMDLRDPAQKARLIEKITEKIKEWEDPVMIHESLKKLASLMQVPEAMLGISEFTISPAYSSSANLKSTMDVGQRFLETDVLIWLLQRDLPTEEFLKIAQKNLELSMFEDVKCANIYRIISQAFAENRLLDSLSLLIECPDEGTRQLVSTLMEKKIDKEHAKELFICSLQRLLDHGWMNKREAIKCEIQTNLFSEEESLNLAKKFDTLQKSRPQVQL